MDSILLAFYRMVWESIWVVFENHFEQVKIQLKEGNSLAVNGQGNGDRKTDEA